jgi:hypothetical protein
MEEGLVSRDRRAIREKIETEPMIRKWFQDLHQANYLSQDLTPVLFMLFMALTDHESGTRCPPDVCCLEFQVHPTNH